MSQRCFLEVYSKHNNLKDSKQVEYWNKYIELVEPVLSEITNPNNGVIFDDKLYEILPEFKDSKYPLTYYTKVDNDYFVFDNELCCKYFVPDTFLMPFKNEQINYSYKKDYDPINEQFSWSCYTYKTTIEEGISLMENRVKLLKDSKFKTSCNEVLEFLRGMPLDSLLVLNSGDIYIEENPELMLEEISNIKEMFLRMDNKDK